MYIDDQAGSDVTVTVDDEQYEAEATHDTDGDGRDDTIVVAADQGDTVLVTDVDGDGGADVATEITSDGRITVAEHAGDGEWTVVERGSIDEPGTGQRAGACATDDAGWGESADAAAAAAATRLVVSVDPVTGSWVRS